MARDALTTFSWGRGHVRGDRGGGKDGGAERGREETGPSRREQTEQGVGRTGQGLTDWR